MTIVNTATYGENARSPYNLIPVGKDTNTNVVDVDCSGFEPGIYQFSGSWGLAVRVGYNCLNHHFDIGMNPLSIDTLPSGGAAWGDHKPIPGDAGTTPGTNLLTCGKPVGSRLLAITGIEHVYLHALCNHDGPSNGVGAVYACGALNWHKVADLPT